MQDDLLHPRNVPALPSLSFRRFRGEDDFPRMVAVFYAGKEADRDDRTFSAKDMARWYAHLTNCDPYQDVILAEVDGEVVGYGRACWLQETTGARVYLHEGHVAPAWRRRGIGGALLGWLQHRLRQTAAVHPRDGARWLQAEMPDTETGTSAMLECDGYAIARYFFQMVRPLGEGIPELPLPQGLEVRPALPQHYRQIWDADAEASRDEWGFAPPSEEDYQLWLVERLFMPELWQIAWDGDQVAGQVRTFIDHEENRQVGRLRGYTENISVRRPWRRRTLARALIVRSLRLLQQNGMSEAALGVDSENLSGALSLYEGLGFRPVKRWSCYRKPLATP